MRAARRRLRPSGKDHPVVEGESAADVPSDGLPVGEPGRVRAGLERWLSGADRFDLPEALVEAARALADEVDHEPRNSPLWGRYVSVLTELVSPERRAAEVGAEMQAIVEEVAVGARDEEWRVEQYRKAVERGEDPRRWEQVVPIGCLRGDHRWHRYGPHSPKRCVDCSTKRQALTD